MVSYLRDFTVFSNTLVKHKKQFTTLEIYADLEGCNINGYTIQDNIYPTTVKPDFVFIDNSKKEMYLLELIRHRKLCRKRS